MYLNVNHLGETIYSLHFYRKRPGSLSGLAAKYRVSYQSIGVAGVSKMTFT